MIERDEINGDAALIRDDYFREISRRGDAYGNNGGLLDLLTWCGKIALNQVTVEEAAYFMANPKSPYSDYLSGAKPGASEPRVV